MKTSYKFWYVTKQDDVHISEVAVRFYEGDVATINEDVFDIVTMTTTSKPVTKYRKSKRLNSADLPHLQGRAIVRELSGDDCLLFTDADFGITTDLDIVRAFLNMILGQDIQRAPVDEQKETDIVKIKKQDNK